MTPQGDGWRDLTVCSIKTKCIGAIAGNAAGDNYTTYLQGCAHAAMSHHTTLTLAWYCNHNDSMLSSTCCVVVDPQSQQPTGLMTSVSIRPNCA